MKNTLKENNSIMRQTISFQLYTLSEKLIKLMNLFPGFSPTLTLEDDEEMTLGTSLTCYVVFVLLMLLLFT